MCEGRPAPPEISDFLKISQNGQNAEIAKALIIKKMSKICNNPHNFQVSQMVLNMSQRVTDGKDGASDSPGIVLVCGGCLNHFWSLFAVGNQVYPADSRI